MVVDEYEDVDEYDVDFEEEEDDDPELHELTAIIIKITAAMTSQTIRFVF